MGDSQPTKPTDEKIGRTLARITLDLQTRNANLAMSFGQQMFGDQLQPDIVESSAVLAEEIGHDEAGNCLPVPGDQRREAMPDARRQGKRRT